MPPVYSDQLHQNRVLVSHFTTPATHSVPSKDRPNAAAAAYAARRNHAEDVRMHAYLRVNSDTNSDILLDFKRGRAPRKNASMLSNVRGGWFDGPINRARGPVQLPTGIGPRRGAWACELENDLVFCSIHAPRLRTPRTPTYAYVRIPTYSTYRWVNFLQSGFRISLLQQPARPLL